MLIAAAVLQAGLAGTAQSQNAVPPAPATNATDVGPPQLRDFTLNGTVTRPAETPAARPAPSSPAATAPRSQPSSTTPLPPARAPSAVAPTPAPSARSTTIDLPPPSPSAALPPAGGELVEDSPLPAPVTFAPEPPAMPDSPAILPWLLAALLLGGGAAFYVFRVRPRAQVADGPQAWELRAPEPEQPQPRAPSPAPEPRPRAAAPAGSGGVVSTSLRPWIEVEFIPERAIVEDETIAIEFTVALYNSGSAPARDVLIEAAMFNASSAQDQQIGAFFASPTGRGDRIEMVAPLQRVVARSAVTVPRGQVRPLLADGRPLLVPMTAITALYRWGSNNHGQTSASYLVGKETGGDKLAPFRLDLGPRVFRGLAAREHQLRVRK